MQQRFTQLTEYINIFSGDIAAMGVAVPDGPKIKAVKANTNKVEPTKELVTDKVEPVKNEVVRQNCLTAKGGQANGQYRQYTQV